MEKEITEILLNYRECARHVWNTYYRCIEDGWHRFIDAEDELFTSLVLDEFYPALDYPEKVSKSMRTFKVVPIIPPLHLEILWTVTGDETVHKWKELKLKDNAIELRYFDFFDWEETGYRDYKYIRCKVADFGNYSELKDADVLIEVEHLKVFLMEE